MEMLKKVNLWESSSVEVSYQNDANIVKREAVPHRSLEERITSFYGKPLSEIDPVFAKEYDWGERVGAEEW